MLSLFVAWESTILSQHLFPIWDCQAKDQSVRVQGTSSLLPGHNHRQGGRGGLSWAFLPLYFQGSPHLWRKQDPTPPLTGAQELLDQQIKHFWQLSFFQNYTNVEKNLFCVCLLKGWRKSIFLSWTKDNHWVHRF